MLDLFSPFHIKGLELKNRIMMSPMCQYSVTAEDGTPTNWHLQHYVSRAVGGTGLVMIEMTDVEPDGRISNRDLGLWSDDQIKAYAKIVEEVHQYGAKIGIQIAHAGRKAEDAQPPVAPSAIAFDDTYKTPRALETKEVKEMVEKFQSSARRAVQAGFDTIELHGAHGYLIHQFLSPLTNKRDDEYGMDLNKFGVEVIKAVKSEMPVDMPLMMRISGKEYVEDGYGLEESISFAKVFKDAGVDVFDVSSGGEGPIGAGGRPGTHAGYQSPLAMEIKRALEGVPVISVGRLDNPVLANSLIGNEVADIIAVGRGMLRNPYWSLEASKVLNKQTEIPKQYMMGFK